MSVNSRGQSAASASPAVTEEALPGDLRMARTLWPVLVASAVGLLPFTIFSTYLVPMAEDADSSVATLGGLRGLGGLAALLVGTALAPLIDRVRKEWAAAGGLAALGVSAALGASGDFILLAVFCLLVGASTSVLNPALTAAAADRFGSGKAAGRAATLVTATQSMTAMLAAPVIALPALLWGWQGDLFAVTGVSLLLAAIFYVRGKDKRVEAVEPTQRLGYAASFASLARIPGVAPLLLIALLRTAVFMGYLSYLAAYYDDRFQLGPGLFAFVWTLSGASFFVSNLLTGRVANSEEPRIGTERLLAIGLVAALVSVVGFYFTHWLPLALAMTSLHAASHAVVAACVISLLVRRCGTQRGAALSVNAAGMSLGVFAGAGLGGLGLGLAGYAGIAATFGLLVVAALVAAVLVLRAEAVAPGGRDPEDGGPSDRGPGYRGPGYPDPSYPDPSYRGPSDPDPSDPDPGDQDPGDRDRGDRDPGTDQPADGTPPKRNPTTQTPTNDDPAVQTPTDDDPTTQPPTDDDPTTQTPTNDDPAVQTPTDDAPAKQNPTSHVSPANEIPAADGPEKGGGTVT
ncbi:MFS transporter [Streptomyces sp. NPDC051218]|uniref:MFS transporter n=1 Tax=Streptomyces sp. NPDC051218 TaxID=3365645 RepID=UPI0037B7B4A2